MCIGNVWYLPEQLHRAELLDGKQLHKFRYFTIKKYTNQNFTDCSSMFNIYKFDMSTGQFTKTDTQALGRVLTMHVDENEIATFCVDAKCGRDEEEVHRFALG